MSAPTTHAPKSRLGQIVIGYRQGTPVCVDTPAKGELDGPHKLWGERVYAGKTRIPLGQLLQPRQSSRPTATTRGGPHTHPRHFTRARLVVTLVALVCLTPAATFAVCGNRRGTAIAAWFGLAILAIVSNAILRPPAQRRRPQASLARTAIGARATGPNVKITSACLDGPPPASARSSDTAAGQLGPASPTPPPPAETPQASH